MEKYSTVDGAVVTLWGGEIQYIVLFVSLSVQLSVTLLLAAANLVAFFMSQSISSKISFCECRTLISVVLQCTITVCVPVPN